MSESNKTRFKSIVNLAIHKLLSFFARVMLNFPPISKAAQIKRIILAQLAACAFFMHNVVLGRDSKDFWWAIEKSGL